MKRDLSLLAGRKFDLLVIGAGIHGACTAWDAALRGLSVALIDKGDFSSGTSANSMKIIHGGLRYLQQLDFARMRESSVERRTLMRIAPHLVHPVPCLIPTYKGLLKSRTAMFLAMLVNDIVSFDRNSLKDVQKHIPRGRIISKQECLELVKGMEHQHVTGGAVWSDAQVHNPERLVISVIRSAEEQGAAVANYAGAVGFLRKGSRVTGASVRDALTGDELDVRARVTVNTCGAWGNDLGKMAGGSAGYRGAVYCKAINIITRPLTEKYAVGIMGRGDSVDDVVLFKKNPRLFFITPWRGHSIVGTAYLPFEGSADEIDVTGAEIGDLISEINYAYPAAHLSPHDVLFVHRGLVPADTASLASGIKLARHFRITDHEAVDGTEGLISLTSVKYTTARHVAGKLVDRVFEKMRRPCPPAATADTPVYGGRIEGFNEFLSGLLKIRPGWLDEKAAERLGYNYGSAYGDVLGCAGEGARLRARLSDTTAVTGAEVVHAVREEMAQKLEDVVLRRTELGTAGYPGDECLGKCASLMSDEIGWSEAKKEDEIKEVKDFYRKLHCRME